MKTNRTSFIILFLAACTLITSCTLKTKYVITDANISYINIDSTFDTHLYDVAQGVLDEYYAKAHAIMDDTIGYCDYAMSKTGTENLLCNYTADAIRVIGQEIWDSIQIDMGLLNKGGIRTDMAKGPITVGDVCAIYPFDNCLTLLAMKGSDLRDLFKMFAKQNRYEAFSGPRLVVKNGKLESVTMNGKKLEDDKIYYVVTIDYVAEGNDGMPQFKNAISVTYVDVIERDAMIAYIKELTAAGKHIRAKIDGRITVL